MFSILLHPQNNEPTHCKDGTKLQILSASGITPPLLGNLSLNLEYELGPVLYGELGKLIFSSSTKWSNVCNEAKKI